MIKFRESKSGVFTLVHATNRPMKKLISSNREGIYFFLAEELNFPFEEFNNIISKDEVEKIIQNNPEDANIYFNIAFNYGDYLHVVNVKLNKIFDFNELSFEERISWLENNIKEYNKLNDSDKENVAYKFYDTEYESLINLKLQQLGYDAFIFEDNIEGYPYNAVVVLNSIIYMKGNV